MRNLHLSFILCSASKNQKYGEDFAKFRGLLRIYEVYEKVKIQNIHISSEVLRRPEEFGPSSTYNLTLLKVLSNEKWKMGQIFVAFSEYPNFKSRDKILQYYIFYAT